MSLRVAFDLDGTLADMEQVLRREAARLFGSATAPAIDETAASPDDSSRGAAELTAADLPASPNIDLTSRQWARLWAHARKTEDFWLSLPEIDQGIVAHIAALALARRWDVLFVTTRPTVKGQPTQLQTQKWLQQHGFAFPSVFVVQRSRGLIAAALELDALVDDRLENCVDVALESKATPILIRRSSGSTPTPESRPSGVRVVASIRDAVALLERMDDDRHPGVVGSIKKWFGRTPHPGN